MSKAKEKQFTRLLNQAEQAVNVASIYVSDGALNTAAERLEKAAQSLRHAAKIKNELVGA